MIKGGVLFPHSTCAYSLCALFEMLITAYCHVFRFRATCKTGPGVFQSSLGSGIKQWSRINQRKIKHVVYVKAQLVLSDSISLLVRYLVVSIAVQLLLKFLVESHLLVVTYLLIFYFFLLNYT